MYRLMAMGLILLAVTTTIYFKISGLEDQVKDLKESLNAKTISLANVTSGYETLVKENAKLTGVVQNNNTIVDNMAIDYKTRIAIYKKELAKKPKVVIKKVYETIYKDIGHKVDFEKATCEEGKSIMRFISESLKLEDI